MIIGIIGLGVIGKANKNGFEYNSHEVIVHDIKLNTNIKNLLIAEIIYLCLPTPTDKHGRCDTSIIEKVLNELYDLKCKKPIVIRSTVTPGFTELMQSKFKDLIIGFAPEFLRERCATDDFINNHSLLAVGSSNSTLINLVIESHGSLPLNTKVLSTTEAEILKYFNNVYAALRITFANNMYELTRKLNVDYEKIKSTYCLTGKTSGQYLSADDDLRGFAGPCLPKDTKALSMLFKDLGLQVELIDAILNDNDKYKATVFPGMRL